MLRLLLASLFAAASACAHQLAPGCPTWAQQGERFYAGADGFYGVGSAELGGAELARPTADNRARAELVRGLGQLETASGSEGVFAAENLAGAEVVERCVDTRGRTHSLLRLAPGAFEARTVVTGEGPLEPEVSSPPPVPEPSPCPPATTPGGGERVLRPVADLSPGHWRGQTGAQPIGIGGVVDPVLWDKLDELEADPTDNVFFSGGAQAAQFIVALAPLCGRPAPGARVILRVTHRGDFENATPGYAELRAGNQTLLTLPLDFGHLPFHIAAAELPSEVREAPGSWNELSVLVRSKANSPTDQDLSIVSQLELWVSAVVAE